jgi:7-cyano-7-deazaguanine reductase
MAKPARRRTPATERSAPAVPPSRPSRELQVFDNPSPKRDYLIQFQIPEFTCLCPLTGQPDFAHFTIEMVADRRCVELKSLKLYMWSYRDEGAFHEKVTNAIVDDIVQAADPRFVRITARWYVRGGIYTNVIAEHRRKGWRGAKPVDLPLPAAATGMMPAP